jgi:uncharacterized damage-inducible protein DinB
MAWVTIARPDPSEYVPYFATYVDKVPPGDVMTLLGKQVEETVTVLKRLSEEQALFRYAPGKWSIKQVVGHIGDTERIFVYRALCFARGDKQALPGFEENLYVEGARFDDRTLSDHLAELRAVRAATVRFFAALNAEELMRTGVANQKKYSVRAIPFIIAGHERHHLAIIRERYLKTGKGQ